MVVIGKTLARWYGTCNTHAPTTKDLFHCLEASYTISVDGSHPEVVALDPVSSPYLSDFRFEVLEGSSGPHTPFTASIGPFVAILET